MHLIWFEKAWADYLWELLKTHYVNLVSPFWLQEIFSNPHLRQANCGFLKSLSLKNLMQSLHKQFLEVPLYWQNQDKKTLKKINNLIRDIERNPEEKGMGKAEMLRGELSGFCSRRIDEANRLVYRIVSGGTFKTKLCEG